RDDRDDDIAQPATRRRFDERAATPARSSDDGTVSSTRWKPKAAAPQNVWRPPADVDPAPPTEPDRRATLPKDPHRKGGIAFDDDDDLADYMHPDDLPPKPGDS
nr:hypothetical protein [Myxococcota bacterium]